jgi:3-mercaptopyruvate sulfurtransferase SseA
MTANLSHPDPWDKVVNVDDFFRRLSSPESVNIIDARLGSTFSKGMIPGSINLDVTSSIHKFRASVSRLNRDLPTFVFCNSEDCNWADLVAARLGGFGFSDVRVFRGGYVSYLERRSLMARLAGQRHFCRPASP